jgi:hypothetical protein
MRDQASHPYKTTGQNYSSVYFYIGEKRRVQGFGGKTLGKEITC